MRNSATINEAFRDIKTATGVTDVQEMVKRFLTREQTYSQLLVNVNESETKIDKLKKDNDELRNRLHDLKMDSEPKDGEKDSGVEKFNDEDIINSRNIIAQ